MFLPHEPVYCHFHKLEVSLESFRKSALIPYICFSISCYVYEGHLLYINFATKYYLHELTGQKLIWSA